MNLKSIHSVYFIGIGGIGMSSLAKFFLEKGIDVYGYDKTPSPITYDFEKMGVSIIYEDNPGMLPEKIDAVIYTPAIKERLNITDALENRKIPFFKRAEALGHITKNYPVIAVAGTHGKTTVSSIIVHLLKTAGIKINGFVGGMTKNYKSNYIGDSNPDWIVVEADEYDRSFLHLNPTYAIITSIDADHLDIYQDKASIDNAFIQFINKIDKNGHLILNNRVASLANRFKNTSIYSYNNNASNFYASKVSTHGLINNFDIAGKTNIKNIRLKVPGIHNIENSLAAVAVGSLLEITPETIIKALNTYEGVQRRFDIRFNNSNIFYIDDYAHHPEELRAIISSVKELLPNKKITGVFQPHLYSRTKDFADGFAESLQLLDRLILLDIYPAREKPIEGVSSKLIFEKVKIKDKHLLRKENVIDFLNENELEVLLTMGAGDIDRLADPITQLISQKATKSN